MSRRQQITLIAVYVIAAITTAAAINVTFFDRGYYEMMFVDIGQGDSALIRTRHNETVLIDGGDEGSGEYTLSRLIAAKGIRHVSAVFLSHIHADHITGIIEIINDDIKVDRIYVGDRAEHAESYNTVKTAADEHDIPITALHKGDSVNIDGADFKILTTGIGVEPARNENDNSVVMRCDIGSNSALFTGDATHDTENELMLDALIDTDILKAGHHGSAGSSSEDFIAGVSPIMTVISAGANNRYGHPTEKALGILKKSDSAVFRTDLDGSVTIIMTETDILSIRTMVGGD